MSDWNIFACTDRACRGTDGFISKLECITTCHPIITGYEIFAAELKMSVVYTCAAEIYSIVSPLRHENAFVNAIIITFLHFQFV